MSACGSGEIVVVISRERICSPCK